MYFDNIKGELPIKMPNSKNSGLQTVNALGNRLPDRQVVIDSKPLENSNKIQPLVTKANPGEGSQAATERNLKAVAAAQQHKCELKCTKALPSKYCRLCGNTFTYQHALDEHMRRHNNERPFSCEVCNKAFITNVDVRRHMRVHTGEKPYSCKYCDRRFSDFGSNRKHERTHTGERPFVCDVCEKDFNYSHALTAHKRTHTGEKPFQCNECDKGFTKKAYLLAHMDCHRRARLLAARKRNDDVADEDAIDNDLDDKDASDDDVDINDCSTYTIIYADGSDLEECVVTSDSENQPC